MLPAYAELHCLSNFTFLRGTSHAEEFAARAQALGYSALQFKTSSAIHSMPITYTHKGRQYITVINGRGGNSGINNPAIRQHVSPGASVWTFALMEE